MKLTVEISDKRVPFFLELIKSLGFVKSIKKIESKHKTEKILTHRASEKSLAKEWISPKEDEAWKDL